MKDMKMIEAAAKRAGADIFINKYKKGISNY